MKIKSNVRAGKKGADDAAGGSKSKSKSNDDVVVPVVPVSRCVGI